MFVFMDLTIMNVLVNMLLFGMFMLMLMIMDMFMTSIIIAHKTCPFQLTN
ncbi:hypothetical protein LPY66_06695 [Dehalobacter sp. DCM]|nr:hypothetical protein LPY66_06695 [Dehalobacter sp. DCM]